jgi:hypothetical protein
VKVDLPSENWAELRTRLRGRDKLAVQRALKFEVSKGQTTQKVSAALQTEMAYALLGEVILAWSFEDITVLLDLDLDDLNALERAVAPMVEKVGFTQGEAT